MCHGSLPAMFLDYGRSRARRRERRRRSYTSVPVLIRWLFDANTPLARTHTHTLAVSHCGEMSLSCVYFIVAKERVNIS